MPPGMRTAGTSMLHTRWMRTTITTAIIATMVTVVTTATRTNTITIMTSLPVRPISALSILHLVRYWVAYAVRARFPDCAPSDALPWLAIDRQIDRGPNEGETSYRARLKLWLDLWRHAGSAQSVITALEVWWGGGVEISTVAQSQPGIGTAWDTYVPAKIGRAHV